MNTQQSTQPQDEVPTEGAEANAGAATDTAAGTAAPCTQTAPAGFEEFDLDDIEVIESKVFA